MTKVFIVRHGATKMNAQAGVSVDKERGWSDVPLTTEGRLEAQKAGIKLRGKGIEHISSSNLHRAQETAVTIGHHLGIHPKFDHDLRPWNLGDLTGKDMKQAQPEMEKHARETPDIPVPGGESFNKFVSRAAGGVARHLHRSNGGRNLLVTHHRVERLLHSLRPDDTVDLNEFFKDGDPPGGVMTMDLDERQLQRLGARNSGSPSPRTPGRADPRQQSAAIQDPTDHRSHALAIGGAHHLHKAGHITKAERDRLQKKARAAMVMRAALRPE